MGKVKAFIGKFNFGDAEKYLIFLKEQLLNLKPQYYVVTHHKKLDTENGVMYAITLNESLEVGEYEVIAECKINNVLIYLWRDHCWAIAVDKLGSPIYSVSASEQTKVLTKTIIVHRVGSQKVE